MQKSDFLLDLVKPPMLTFSMFSYYTTDSVKFKVHKKISIQSLHSRIKNHSDQITELESEHEIELKRMVFHQLKLWI